MQLRQHLRRVPALVLIGTIIASALALAQATRRPPRFDEIQPSLFAAGSSLTNAFADVDGDGDLDLFVGFNGAPNRLYRNMAGVFRDIAPEVGLAQPRPTRGAAWGDFDGDGDPDLAVGFAPGQGTVVRLYRNDGAAFSDITASSGIAVDSAAVRQMTWVDADGDGDLDLFVALRDKPNLLYRNDAGHFTDIAATVGLADPRKSVGAVWFDYDGDGDLDVYVANMDGDANGLFQNTEGRFVDVAVAAGVAWGGRTPGDAGRGTVRPCAADVDGDGRFDLMMANYGPAGLFLNRGTRFTDVSTAWGVAIDSRYDTCAPGDYDNDGRVDLYLNGTVTGGVSYRDYLFHNEGTTYSDVTPDNLQALQADHGAEWADLDGDGRVELALTGSRPDGMHLVFRNAVVNGNHALAVRVLDAKGRATLAGAEVRVYAPGTTRLIADGLVDGGSGYDAQNDAPVHLGVGTAARVDVRVTYPRAGKRITAVVRGVRVRQDEHATALTVRVP
ncbi:MAG: CRTAC1 family protein [Gemmatimonadaceae bacterium]